MIFPFGYDAYLKTFYMAEKEYLCDVRILNFLIFLHST